MIGLLNHFNWIVLPLALSACNSVPALAYTETVDIDHNELSLSLSIKIDSPIMAGEQWLAEFVIRNEGLVTLSLLPWGTPWEGNLTQDIFEIERAGQRIEFIGPVFKRRAPSKADYIEIQPGASRTVELDIRIGYDLEQSGEYSLIYRPGSLALLSLGIEHVVAAPEMQAIIIHQLGK